MDKLQSLQKRKSKWPFRPSLRSKISPPYAPSSSAVCVLSAAAALSCSASQTDPSVPPKTAPPLAEKNSPGSEPILHGEEALPWAPQTFSPQPGSTPEPSLELAEKACGEGDAALHEAARILSELHAQESEVPPLDIAAFHLRRLGSPYVMPRLWSATVKGVSDEDLADSIGKWASTRHALGKYRCGLGLTEGSDGEKTISVLQVDVLAEVKPVPTQVEAGAWIDFSAQLLAPTSSATVLLLPPEGLPRHLSTQIDKGTATARFSIETKGTWLIQLMATQMGGPRPVAQMLVTADRPPPASLDARPVPGEDAFDDSLEKSDALFALMNAARKDQGLPILKRNKTLDEVALAHNRAMMKSGRISHDTGQGDPAYRVGLAGLSPKATGENVAMAGTVVRLHRVLWASPAHRENLLLRRWDQAGVAVTAREDGALYATQLFTDQE